MTAAARAGRPRPVPPSTSVRQANEQEQRTAPAATRSEWIGFGVSRNAGNSFHSFHPAFSSRA